MIYTEYLEVTFYKLFCFVILNQQQRVLVHIIYWLVNKASIYCVQENSLRLKDINIEQFGNQLEQFLGVFH